jgi:hypothetical protein
MTASHLLEQFLRVFMLSFNKPMYVPLPTDEGFKSLFGPYSFPSMPNHKNKKAPPLPKEKQSFSNYKTSIQNEYSSLGSGVQD